MERSSAWPEWALQCVVVAAYLGAIVMANAVVSAWGQTALLFTAWVLIPFDLVARDLLQDRWRDAPRWAMWLAMSALILGGAGLSWATSAAPARICLACFAAFTTAGFLDAATYEWMVRRGRFFRIAMATLVGALVDSGLFVLIAFDDPDPALVLSQAASKVVGGLAWGVLLLPLFSGPSEESKP